MGTVAVLLNLDEGCVASVLQEAMHRLDDGEREIVLDFSAVHRVSASDVHAIDDFTRAAEDKGVKVVARCLGVELYRALKLARLSSRLSLVA